MIKPIHGLTELGDFCNEKLCKHQRDDLGMKESTGSHSLFFKHISNRLFALPGNYVHDILRTAGNNFLSQSLESTQNKFASKKLENPPLVFIGPEISGKKHFRNISHNCYFLRLLLLDGTAYYEDIWFARAKLSWVSNKRQNIWDAIFFSSRRTPATFSWQHFMLTNKNIRHLKPTSDLRRQFSILNLNSLNIFLYFDVVYNWNMNHISKLRFIFILMYDFQKCCVLHYSLQKYCKFMPSSLPGKKCHSCRLIWSFLPSQTWFTMHTRKVDHFINDDGIETMIRCHYWK